MADLASISLTAEQALLGGLMLDASAWDRVCDQVSEADFSWKAHRVVFAAIADQAARCEPFDLIVLAERMRLTHRLEALNDVGGLAYLSMIHANTPSAANVAHYARLVRDYSIRRQVAAVCYETAESAQSGETEATTMLEAATHRFGEIAEQAQRGGGMLDARALMRSTVEYLDAAMHRSGDLLGLGTGLKDLDAKTAGFQPGDLIILAARPSMGKTTLAMNIAEHAATKAEHPVVVFSLEMSATQLGLRLVASIGRVDFGRLREARLDESEWCRVTAATGTMRSAKLMIDDAAGLTLNDISARARRIHREQGGLALIVVDYLQLVTTRERSENRNLEVAKISAGLKALAKSLNVPVLALSQLNRSVEQRANKRPILSDLRDSGSIEQDADVIAFLYRDEVYNEDSPDKGTAELILGKQRNGETGTLRLAFLGRFSRFDTLAPDWQRQERAPERRSQPRRGVQQYDY